MTITEPRPTTTRERHMNGDTPTLTDQVVLSGAGLTSQGLASGRQVIAGMLDVVDTLVTGMFDGAEDLVRSTIATELAIKGITVTRDAWTTGIGTARTALTEI
jgi:hypothetical protein